MNMQRKLSETEGMLTFGLTFGGTVLNTSEKLQNNSWMPEAIREIEEYALRCKESCNISNYETILEIIDLHRKGK